MSFIVRSINKGHYPLASIQQERGMRDHKCLAGPLDPLTQTSWLLMTSGLKGTVCRKVLRALNLLTPSREIIRYIFLSLLPLEVFLMFVLSCLILLFFISSAEVCWLVGWLAGSSAGLVQVWLKERMQDFFHSLLSFLYCKICKIFWNFFFVNF